MSRRTRGDGALYQRHDHATCPPLDPTTGKRTAHKCRGRWVGIAVVTISGRKRRKAVYGRDQKTARIRLAQVKEDAKKGVVNIGTLTLGDWLDYWLKDIAGRKLKPQTLAGYDSKVRTLIKPHLGPIRLHTLQPENVRAWHDTLRTKGSRTGGPLAEASVRQAHAILLKAVGDAVKDGKLSINPIAHVDAPGTLTADREAFTINEASRILVAAGMDARWWLALFYGFRQGEALGLRACDIDFANNQIRVEQTLQIGTDRQVVFGPPKTKKSQRTMPMLAPIATRLRLSVPVGAAPGLLVFNVDDEPVKPWNDSRAWHTLLDRAGVRQLPLHSARHTAASVLEAAGVPDRLVMQILGQSQVATTHKYTHAEIGRQADALQAAFELLSIES